MDSVIAPKEPKGDGWQKGPRAPLEVTLGYEGYYWFYPSQGITVISAVEVAQDPDDVVELGPEYHISVSKNGGRCSRNEARFVLKAFNMQDAEEDNHVPYGFVRNFWQPVADKYVGHVCPCKATEPAMVENKGDFVWRGLEDK